MRGWFHWLTSRRRLLGAGGAAAIAGAFGAARGQSAKQPASVQASTQVAPYDDEPDSAGNGSMITVGQVDNEHIGFDPSVMLNDWDTGSVSKLPDGRTLREFNIVAQDKEIQIAPGLMFPAWTYNGRVPGPTLRVSEGDHVRITFTNAGSHTHTMHFHGIHSARMDGVPGAGEAAPGETFVYEFDAYPFGCHLYHCHSIPLKRHIHKGLYGAFIVDPDPARHPEPAGVAASRLLGTPENARWQEFVMVMNGFDTNFDEENEIYSVNTVAHAYVRRPIAIERARPVRVYLVNATEFDPINSFHLHANFFDYYDTGTSLNPTLETIDTVMQCQAQRGILEFSFAEHETGMYMFHAHQSEFAELGWMGFFDVRDALA
jgi:FtsP/CotA-like multicopper oxidase with cupredoxin domain